MKNIFFLFLLLTTKVWSQVSIEVIPQTPAKDEVFQILFKCHVEDKVDPEISFDAKGFEVLSKQSQGVSTRTTYQAGKITVTRELLISYTAIAKKNGTATVANPKIRLGSKLIQKNDLSFQVLEKPAGPRLVFVSADVSKDEVYENEGITLRYYLYRRVGIQATDIKKYPKLDVFMKRYLQENENPERVSINGELFTRSTIYAARIYPESAGEFEVDPIELTVSYSKENMGSFGLAFGLSGRDLVTRSISSEPIKIKVKPLPLEGRPENFSGLVGEHKFDLTMGRSNILVNEPLEIRVSVNGPGKLESLIPFKIFDTPALERFDVKADLALVGSEGAIKTFAYTYLGKSNATIPSSKLEIAYFDPQQAKYINWTSDISEVRVAGGNVRKETTTKESKKEKDNLSAEEPSSDLVVVLVNEDRSLWLIGGLIGLLVLAVPLYLFSKMDLRRSKNASFDITLKAFKRGQYSYKDMALLLSQFDPEGRGGLRQILGNSPLTKETQNRLGEMLDKLDRQMSSGQNEGPLPRLDRAMLKELNSLLKDRNEAI